MYFQNYKLHIAVLEQCYTQPTLRHYFSHEILIHEFLQFSKNSQFKLIGGGEKFQSKKLEEIPELVEETRIYTVDKYIHDPFNLINEFQIITCCQK